MEYTIKSYDVGFSHRNILGKLRILPNTIRPKDVGRIVVLKNDKLVWRREQ